jgi:chemotaxis response regulator CheB
MAVRVLLVDDVPEMRAFLRACLHADGRCEVVGTASNGLQAIALTEELRPDVVVLDLKMPIMHGVEALPKIRSVMPFIRIIVVSSDDAADAEAATSGLGVDVVLEKGRLTPEILASAVAGQPWMG